MNDAMHRFSMLNVDSAPESPGIYAWYVQPQLPPDLPVLEQDDEQAALDFLVSLERYAVAYEPPPLQLRAESAYGSRWLGSLISEYNVSKLYGYKESSQSAVPSDEDGFVSHSNDSDDEFSPFQSGSGAKLEISLQRVARSPNLRAVMTQALEQAVPNFAAPLYIGIANNLRKRLVRHKSDFTRISDYLNYNPHAREDAAQKAKTFGHRAAARRLSMNDLEVWTLDIGNLADTSMDASEIGQVSRSIEWYFHRIFSPILGRR